MLFVQEVTQDSQVSLLFWAVVVPVAIVFISLIIEYRTGFFSNPKKEISYEIVSVAPLARMDSNYNSDVKILYKDVPVGNVSSLVIKITNTGRAEVRRDDYHSPFQLIFNEDSSIIETPVLIKKKPDNLQVNLMTIRNNVVTVEEMLLNKKDSFTLSILLANYKNLKVEARIAGVSKIKHIDVGKTDVFITRLGLFIIIISVVIIGVLGFLDYLASDLPDFRIIPFLVLCVFLVLFFSSFFLME